MNQNPREPLFLPSLSIQLKDREKGSSPALISNADQIRATLQPRELIKDGGEKVWSEVQQNPGSLSNAAREILAVSWEQRGLERQDGLCKGMVPQGTCGGPSWPSLHPHTALFHPPSSPCAWIPRLPVVLGAVGLTPGTAHQAPIKGKLCPCT